MSGNPIINLAGDLDLAIGIYFLDNCRNICQFITSLIIVITASQLSRAAVLTSDKCVHFSSIRLRARFTLIDSD